MPKGDNLGEFEHIVLLALLRLRESAYGMRIRQEILIQTGRSVSIGAIYATLERMEAKGYVSSRLSDPTPERGGRAKRFFSVQGRGFKVLKRAEQALHSMRKGIRVLGSMA
jgi:DNA-binding PadR family transcriptional regulator